MSRKDQVRSYNALKSFYGGKEPPLEEVMAQLKLPADEAEELIAYIHNPPRRGRPPKMKVIKDKPKLDMGSISLIRWPMLFVGIGALIGSIYFMVDKIAQTQPFWLAMLLGVVLICFGTMCYEVAVYQKRSGNKTWRLFILIWIFIIIYSITATTGSFYNRSIMKKQKQENALVSTSSQKMIYDKYQSQINGYDAEIYDRRIKLTNFQKILEKYADPSLVRGKEYTEAYWSASALEGAIRECEKKKNDLVTLQLSILKDNPNIVKDANLGKTRDYSEQIAYIFRFWKWDPAVVQFTIDTIPSALLDIISSLSLYVFLFFGKKELDSEEEKQ